MRTVILQRMARHEHPAAVAAALRGIPRTAAFDGLEALAALSVPTLIVGSRDDVDPDHPLAVAEEYARAHPGRAARGGGRGRVAARRGAVARSRRRSSELVAQT